MKVRGVLASILFIGWFGIAPVVAGGCCHHSYHCDDCDTNHSSYSDDYCNHGQGSSHCRWASSGVAADLQTAEGRIAEIEYLPGTTSDSGMVEIHLQSAGHAQLVRLAPVGYLKQSGLVLREGDILTVKGFPVSGMDGDLLVATEIHKGDTTLSLPRLSRPVGLVGCARRKGLPAARSGAVLP